MPPAAGIRAYDEDTARAVEGAVRALVDTGSTRAISILEHNRVLLDCAAEQPFQAEVLNRVKIDALSLEVVSEARLEAAHVEPNPPQWLGKANTVAGDSARPASTSATRPTLTHFVIEQTPWRRI